MRRDLHFDSEKILSEIARAGRRLPMPLVAAALALLFQVACTDLNGIEFFHPNLNDGDGYTWLTLVEAHLETGRWSPVVPSHNAPYGLETHLTRLFAEVVRLLTLPVGLFLPPKETALLAGMLSGPLLYVATAALVAWGASAVLGSGGTLLAATTFLMSPRSLFSLYQYDHHALHICLAAAVMAFLLRHAVGAGQSARMAGGAGAAAGIGIWAGTELLLPAGVGGLALGLTWVLWGGNRHAQGLWLYALAMAAALIAALAVERPPEDWMSLASDRISATHVLLGALFAGGAGVVALTQTHWPRAGAVLRCTVAASTAGGTALGLWAIVPDFFRGPYGVLDGVVEDFLSGLALDRGAWSLFAASPDLVGYFLVPCILATMHATLGLRGRHREAWLVILVGMASTALFAFWTARLLRHYMLFVSIPLGGAAAALGHDVWHRAPKGLRATAAFAVLGVMLSPHVGAIGALAIGDLIVKKDAADVFWASVSDQEACDWRSLGIALADLPKVNGSTIATYPHHGAELAYLSGLGVVATGCHCNAAGMADVLAILLSQPESARVVAERRGVEFILQCPAARGSHGHDWYIKRSEPHGLYARLARGEPPDWLTPVPASEIGVDGFLIHRTKFNPSTGVPAPKVPMQ